MVTNWLNSNIGSISSTHKKYYSSFISLCFGLGTLFTQFDTMQRVDNARIRISRCRRRLLTSCLVVSSRCLFASSLCVVSLSVMPLLSCRRCYAIVVPRCCIVTSSLCWSCRSRRATVYCVALHRIVASCHIVTSRRHVT